MTPPLAGCVLEHTRELFNFRFDLTHRTSPRRRVWRTFETIKAPGPFMGRRCVMNIYTVLYTESIDIYIYIYIRLSFFLSYSLSQDSRVSRHRGLYNLSLVCPQLLSTRDCLIRDWISREREIYDAPGNTCAHATYRFMYTARAMWRVSTRVIDGRVRPSDNLFSAHP